MDQRSPALQADSLPTEPPGKPILQNNGLKSFKTAKDIKTRREKKELFQIKER